MARTGKSQADKDAQAARLIEARAAAGYDSAHAAAIKHDWKTSTYGAHENGTNGFGAGVAQRYAKAFGVSWRWLLDGEGAKTDTPPTDGVFTPVIVPGRELVGPSGFPIYAATQGGEGHLIITTEVIETVKWPSILDGVRGAYGIRIVGDSMAKAYRQGDMALVHPNLPMKRDEVHILYDAPPFGEAGSVESIIKNVLSWTDKKMKLEQFNPHRIWDVDRVDWPIAHRVVGKYSER